ncbi:MAG TPA: 4-hydroxy-tetrahydrodipicolinate synthase [Acetobacteraceae bacterium]|jgi:4-hydroxy-tetrahydrodipicolinate synthase|nr:4-hydroxy-tetrahydrodipicolinate synthase [Acetobacteraceae bacterium]
MRNSISGVGGSLTALATPFRDSRVDWDAFGRMAERQIDRGTAALIVCGSTGEAASLTQPEYARAVHFVAQVTQGRVPVIAGCTAMCTSTAMALGTEAAGAGADALLCAVPPYVKPTQEGIFAHIRAISHATDLPIVLYDVPSRSGTAISDDTVARLHDAELIVGLKDATADVTRPPRLRERCGDAFMQWSGDDATAPAYRAMGGMGCISVTSNVAPALSALMHQAWDNGDLSRFAALRDLLHPLHAALFQESNPIPLKAALANLGLCSNEVRLPLTRASLATQEKLLAAMAPVMQAEEHAARRPALALAS